MTRVAAIDCGTNTIKLLVADLEQDGSFVEHLREGRMVRLGQGVDATGTLAPEALARALAAVEEYAGLIGAHHVERTRFCATSAVRDADNAAEFGDAVMARLGVRPEVLSGAEEARLSFAGATRSPGGAGSGGLGANGSASGGPRADGLGSDGRESDDRCLVVDIGGGSTECILGVSGGAVSAAQSLDVGSVRITERHLPTDPPTAREISAARDTIDSALDTLPQGGLDLGTARRVIAVSGTGLTVQSVALGLSELNPDVLQGATVPRHDVRAAARRLLSLTVAERRSLGCMHPGRADVIGAGALILDMVLSRTEVAEMETSVSDILDGIAWSCLE